METIETLASKMTDRVYELEQQRDELAAALRDLLNVCREELDPARVPEMAAARAALAKAQA